MPMNNPIHAIARSRYAALFFVLCAFIFFAIVLSTVLPPVEMAALKVVAPDLSLTISNYVGGLGISLSFGLAGLVGIAVRRFIIRVWPQAWPQEDSISKRHEAVTYAVCFILGVIFTAWYFWSFLHSA